MTTEATTHEATVVNGVNVSAMLDTVDAIKEKPAIAKFKFRAKNQWLDGAHNRTTIKEFYGACAEDTTRTEPFVLDADEAPVLLGNDAGPNPVEYVLAALAGCLTTSLVYHAAALGIHVDEVESTFEGDIDLHGFLNLDDKTRNGYEQIRVTFDIKGDLTRDQKQKLIELAQRRSPVFDIVTNPVPVTVQLRDES